MPPKPLDEITAMIEAGLGKKVHEVFAWLDETPIGAASIGQVHRATLLDGGKAVVVKVQYPEVRKLFDSDFTQIAAACCFWTPQVRSPTPTPTAIPTPTPAPSRRWARWRSCASSSWRS